MRKFILAAITAALVLAAFGGTASAATITVERVGAEALNIETQGSITFTANTIIGQFNIVCNKTMRGHLEGRASGTLVLEGNVAGVIGEVRLSGCSGGTADARLITLADPVRLSWLRVEARRVELAGNRARFLIEIAGLGACLYTALLRASATPEVRGKITEIELTLVSIIETRRLSGICPGASEVTMRGRLRITLPVGGVTVSLRA
jgi:hypothetical protein